MVFLVPYDGSSVSDAALDRAVEHGEAFEEEVVAVSLIPTGTEYAERRKWIEPGEDFAAESARTELRRKISETTDDVERTYDDSGATGVGNGAAEHLRRVARDVDASVLFVGTTGDGDRPTTPFGSIAGSGEYDVHLVR